MLVFFGQVYRAEVTGLYGPWSPPTIVAVKMLKPEPTAKDVSDLFAEIQVLKRVSNPKHKNIINLVGVCTQTGPVFVILEYAQNGNLRDFLRYYRSNSITLGHMHQNDAIVASINQNQLLTTKDLIKFGQQVSHGMHYLHSKCVVHRDLAARNILVTSQLVIKIADFGLARDITESDYYRKKGPTQLPWKWMSLEALTQYIFTTANDIWSFGVLFWEICTLGGSPYPGIKHDQLIHSLKSGARLRKPALSGNEEYQIMQSCWHEDPVQRPNFDKLSEIFDSFLQSQPEEKEEDYIDLSTMNVEEVNEDKESSDEESVHEEISATRYTSMPKNPPTNTESSVPQNVNQHFIFPSVSNV